jgi:uncharacterized protein
MTAADTPQVLSINEFGRPGVSPLSDAELARLLALPNEHLVAIQGSDSVFGYLLAFGRDAPYDGEEFVALRSRIEQPFIYIDQVAVAVGHSRRGVAGALYAEIERVAGEAGISVVCCEVNTNPPNPRSLNFHKKMGFGSLTSLAVSDGREVELLTKVLSQSP